MLLRSRLVLLIALSLGSTACFSDPPPAAPQDDDGGTTSAATTSVGSTTDAGETGFGESTGSTGSTGGSSGSTTGAFDAGTTDDVVPQTLLLWERTCNPGNRWALGPARDIPCANKKVPPPPGVPFVQRLQTVVNAGEELTSVVRVRPPTVIEEPIDGFYEDLNLEGFQDPVFRMRVECDTAAGCDVSFDVEASTDGAVGPKNGGSVSSKSPPEEFELELAPMAGTQLRIRVFVAGGAAGNEDQILFVNPRIEESRAP
ncbi:MAG: hypothetical protein AAGA54_17305 [Myxococcota bacterium]